jgi:hypothetical protein
MRNLSILIIRIYQMTISQILPNSCRFYPTCSEYSITALSQYGLVKGILFSIRRVLRCNPFFAGGYDPVPPPFPSSTCGGRIRRGEFRN